MERKGDRSANGLELGVKASRCRYKHTWRRGRRVSVTARAVIRPKKFRVAAGHRESARRQCRLASPIWQMTLFRYLAWINIEDRNARSMASALSYPLCNRENITSLSGTHVSCLVQFLILLRSRHSHHPYLATYFSKRPEPRSPLLIRYRLSRLDASA